jgi:hypothetical protein
MTGPPMKLTFKLAELFVLSTVYKNAWRQEAMPWVRVRQTFE